MLHCNHTAVRQEVQTPAQACHHYRVSRSGCVFVCSGDEWRGHMIQHIILTIHRGLGHVALTYKAILGWRSSEDGSWTWFEVGGNVAPRRHLVHNYPASRDYYTHHIQWNNSLHDDSDRSEDRQLLEWMNSITGGQELSIFARAQYGGWDNHVQRVLIEVYCACV